jgi:hypothetical protein
MRSLRYFVSSREFGKILEHTLFSFPAKMIADEILEIYDIFLRDGTFSYKIT